MAILNSFQRIDRVLPGFPFGNGSDGAYSSATIPTLTKDSCSGTATSTTLTTAGSTFANGDVLLIHQTRGTGVGQWEINRVSSGGGSTSLTLQVALNYTYTDSGASQAQATKIPMYSNVTVESGTWTVPAWDGNVGGILTFASNGTTTVTGTIQLSGSVGSDTTSDGAGGATGGGFRGGGVGDANHAIQGEGTAGAGSASTSANGNGGGGGNKDAGDNSGGSGANATNGSNGTSGGIAGVAAGSADLTNAVFGGGGGGGHQDNLLDGASGGSSGGAIGFFFIKQLTVAGAIQSKGGDAKNHASTADGSAGAGGSICLVLQSGALGTTLVTAGAGAASGSGVAGSVGRIAIHHSGTVTGTTSPSFTDVTDGTLIEANAGLLMNLL